MGSFAFASILMAVIPFIGTYTPSGVGFGIVSVCVFLSGCCFGISNASAYGLAALLPKKYNAAMVLGSSAGGVMINIIRIICLASFPLDKSGIETSTTIYFLVVAALIAVGILCHSLTMAHPMVQRAIVKGAAREARRKTSVMMGNEEAAAATGLATGLRTASINEGDKPIEATTTWQFIKDVGPFVFWGWLAFGISFTVYPGVAVATTDQYLPYSWLVILLVTTRNLSDTVGKKMTEYWFPSKTVCWIISMSRFIFIATFILIASDDPRVPPGELFNSTWFKFFNMWMFSLTNGFMLSMSATMAPSNVHPLWKNACGKATGTSFIYGGFCGSLIALGLTNVGTHPTGN